MTRLTIRHETRYEYERPVTFGPHRLLVRPRDSHATRILDASLTFSPGGETRWLYDAYGNCVCILQPALAADHLTIISELSLERFPAPLSPILPDDPHTLTPTVYDTASREALAPFLAPAEPDADHGLLRWLQQHAPQPNEPALDFLLRMNSDIHASFFYRERYEEGVQSPADTIRLGGACRDLAWLMVEALRRLGFAARFVTGYIYAPLRPGIRGAGATHAWCEVFLPGLGWTEFDPTNGLAESSDLIAVAVSRTPAEASPISGSITGDPGGSTLAIHVDVAAGAPAQASA